jgi:hypothetical protein
MRKLQEDDIRLVLLGILGAVVLGVLLIPLRELTPAANLVFPFLLLTITVAEVGGAMPVGTRFHLGSASTLPDPPYLTFAIDDKHDALAFTGLAVRADGGRVPGVAGDGSSRPASRRSISTCCARTGAAGLGSGRGAASGLLRELTARCRWRLSCAHGVPCSSPRARHTSARPEHSIRRRCMRWMTRSARGPHRALPTTGRDPCSSAGAAWAG